MAQVYAPERVEPQSWVNAGKIGFVSGGVVSLLFLVFLSVLVVTRQSAPAAVAVQAPASDFSSGRAMRYLNAIAQTPRPPGSAVHERVREYIVNELTALGVEPQVQTTTSAYSRQGNFIQAARVQNVVARLKGSDNSKAVLLAAHYDSVPNSPGASDDGAAVATLLETLRALKSGPPLKNDVILLFTDGEEIGLLGARGFMNEHPWARDVGLALNFEARGSSGPAMMFETSRGNGWLINEFARSSAPRPVTNSLMFELFRLLQNDTDLTAFKEGNLPSLNFAYINNFTSYHSTLDNLTNLDERSLQHHGSYALALARHFGNQSLNAGRAQGNTVYFDLFSATLFHYPMAWVLPLTILITLCFVAVLVLGLRRGQLRIGGIALGSLAFLLSVAGSVLISMIVWWIASALNSLMGRPLSSVLYYSDLYLAGFTALTVGVCIALYLLFARKTSVENLTAGVLLWIVILLVATSLVAPGASYLLMWPLLFSLAGLAFMLFMRDRAATTVTRLVVLTLCAIPTVLLLAPVIYLAYMALGINLAVVGVVVLAIALGMLVPQLSLIKSRRSWLLPAGAALVAIGFVAAAVLMTRVDKLHPRTNSIQYVLNADTGRAVWASNETRPDEWTRQFFPSETEKGSLDDFMPARKGNVYLKGAAPVVTLAPANIDVIDDSTSNNVRTIRLKVSSGYPAMSISTLDDTAGAIVAAAVNGKRFENKPTSAQPSWLLKYWSKPEEPLELTLEVKADQGLKLRVVGQAYELPEMSAMSLKPRPDYMIPARFTDSDSSFVSKSMTFEPRR